MNARRRGVLALCGRCGLDAGGTGARGRSQRPDPDPTSLSPTILRCVARRCSGLTGDVLEIATLVGLTDEYLSNMSGMEVERPPTRTKDDTKCASRLVGLQFAVSDYYCPSFLLYYNL